MPLKENCASELSRKQNISALYYTLGVKPLNHQSELRTYMKVVPFQEKGSFHFVVL